MRYKDGDSEREREQRLEVQQGDKMKGPDLCHERGAKAALVVVARGYSLHDAGHRVVGVTRPTPA